VSEAIPAILSGRLARGLNEKLRFHRYAAGQHLDWEPDEGGLLAFVVFLNDDYEGGAMRFASLEVHGRTGMALVFEHTHRPEVGEVSGGTRYVLRASVMYAPA
jgi:prolyl 4-hydroxylase